MAALTVELRSRGALIESVLCIIDRSNGAHPKLDAIGCSVLSLWTADELVRPIAHLNTGPSALRRYGHPRTVDQPLTVVWIGVRAWVLRVAAATAGRFGPSK